MDMEGVRSSIIAALLFLTLVLAAASGGDDAAAVEEQQCHPLADEPAYMQLGALANTTATACGSDPDPTATDDDEQGYMLIGMQTGGGDKNRLVLVADKRYFSMTGFAQGFSNRPRWFFREGKRHRLLPTLGKGSHSHGSHAEVVASNLLAALLKDGSS